ncbi:MAG: hypothetical protein H6696_21215, partial [Deferribacteres bacterium]|nr:hypothetical protein [Deferribacteres bacterium]
AAQEFYWRGVKNIKTKIDAECQFEVVKYIFTESELQRYAACVEPQDYIELFNQIWLQRDPTPAAQLNVRLIEHLRRYSIAEHDFEYMGVRNQSNNPDKLHRLKFPAPYKLNKEFNDKGFIFLRHGKPDDRVRTLGESSMANESWRYFQRGERPQLTFHFMVDKTALPDNWRLTPLLEDRAMLEDRIDWGSYYHRMLTAPQVEQLSIESELVDESKAAVVEAFTTDRHTFTEDLKPLVLQYSLTTFRGDEGKTVIEVFYRVPLKQLQDEANGKQQLKLNQGISVHDRAWHEVTRDLLYSDITIPEKPVDPRIMVINSFRFSLKPDSLHFALHAKAEQTPLLGAYKFDELIPDYSSPDLHMSDIHLAYAVNPAQNPKFTRKDVDIMVNPSGYFSQEKPFYTYFEVYNLKSDGQEKTRFEVTYQLKLVKSKKSPIAKLFSLFGVGKKSSIALTNLREGDASEAAEHIALDTKSLDAGQYTLTIKIRDLNSNRTVSKTKNLVLY